MTQNNAMECLANHRPAVGITLPSRTVETLLPSHGKAAFPRRATRPSWNVTSINRVTDGRAWVEVDLRHIVANARRILAASRGARLLAVIKSNAYGLGAVQIAKTLDRIEPWGFAVATIDEGIALREAGIGRPLLILRSAQTKILDYYREYCLRPVVETPEVLDGSNIDGANIPFHVEIDTGMGRTGLRWDETSMLAEIGSRRPEGAFTHFHSADVSPESVEVQWDRFIHALAAMKNRPPLVHAANSAGVWRLNKPLDLVRPGIFLYGGIPGEGMPMPEPVVSLKAEIISVRTVRRGESVSYGAEWRAETDTRVATLGIGYADGIPRCLQGEGYVLIGGRRYPLIGRVTMDMIMVDIGAEVAGSPKLGHVVTLIGDDDGDSIELDRFAEWSKTISYEILTRLGNRLPRIYVGE